MPSSSHQDDPPDYEQRAALSEIDRDYPGWHAFPGVVPPLLYARRPMTSPPMVVRAGDPAALRKAIENAERERGMRKAPGEALSSDLDGLHREFSGSGWTFGSIWASAVAGPDRRRLYASRGTVLITAWSASELRMRLRERSGG